MKEERPLIESFVEYQIVEVPVESGLKPVDPYFTSQAEPFPVELNPILAALVVNPFTVKLYGLGQVGAGNTSITKSLVSP